jgi:hypothetical protein
MSDILKEIEEKIATVRLQPSDEMLASFAKLATALQKLRDLTTNAKRDA